MRFTVAKAIAVLATATTVLSVSLPNTGAREIRSFDNIKPLVWHGEMNGEAYELTGTAEEIWAKLKERHPKMQLKKRENLNVETLNKRNKVVPPTCIPVDGQDWNFASLGPIEDGIDYLIGLDTPLNVDAHACTRISCSYNSAIYLCNDNDYQISPASVYLASYAQDIVNDCTHDIFGRFAVTGGQEFDTDNYNIIVRSDSC